MAMISGRCSDTLGSTAGGKQPSAAMSAWNSAMKREERERGSSPTSDARLMIWKEGRGDWGIEVRMR